MKHELRLVYSKIIRLHGQVVKTHPFHGCIVGSIPAGVIGFIGESPLDFRKGVAPM